MSEVPKISSEALAPNVLSLTRFHERLLAEELTSRLGDSSARVTRALSDARVDLNPHQLSAACFAIDSLTRGGCVLADEVGLGKTIDAGIVMAQLVAEGKNRIWVLAAATLRAQWQAELKEKFDLESLVSDGPKKGSPSWDTRVTSGHPATHRHLIAVSCLFILVFLAQSRSPGWVRARAHRWVGDLR